MIDKSCIPYPRKRWYWLISLPYVFVLTITTIYLWKHSVSASCSYLGLYFISIILHGYNCSFSKCPYKNTYCPGAFGWFSVGKVAGIFFKIKIKKSSGLINLFFFLILISILGITILPTFWIINIGIFWVIGYVLFILIHFFTFVVVICPKCAGRSFCPTARLSKKLNKKIFKIEVSLTNN